MTIRPRALLARLDGLAWLAMAAFMAYLALAGDYWHYLNPKFKPLTLSAAVVLAALAVWALLRPVAKPSFARALAYLALAAMVVISQNWLPFSAASPDVDVFALPPRLPAPPKPAPALTRMTVDGKAYIPINTVELLDLAHNKPAGKWTLAYAMRGFVKRDPVLDAKGEFVLWRLAIWCCFADSTATGFKVKLPPGTPLPPDKSWQVAYGHLAAMPEDQRGAYAPPGMSFTSISPDALFVADRVAPAAVVPEEVCVFEWRPAEPYNY
ncbi:DUF1980 domain-containing protein [Desulfovibrio sp. JY]|nr:DUF1980 domain-containing protein [Desulfovibrio sp. JY]